MVRIIIYITNQLNYYYNYAGVKITDTTVMESNFIENVAQSISQV